jgi:hypothetical protein
VESCPGTTLPALTRALDGSALVLENALVGLQLPQHQEAQEALIRCVGTDAGVIMAQWAELQGAARGQC